MKNYKHRYIPPAAIAMEPTRREERQDRYTDTRDNLVAAGIAPAHLFPGEPGMPCGTVVLWPADAKPCSSWRLPGRLTINRLPSGKFTASLTVSLEEQEKRVERKEADQQQRERAWEEQKRLRLAERAAGTSLDVIVELLGEPAVRRRLRELAGPGGQRPQVAHLRLVWSAPRGAA